MQCYIFILKLLPSTLRIASILSRHDILLHMQVLEVSSSLDGRPNRNCGKLLAGDCSKVGNSHPTWESDNLKLPKMKLLTEILLLLLHRLWTGTSFYLRCEYLLAFPYIWLYDLMCWYTMKLLYRHHLVVSHCDQLGKSILI